MQAARFLNDFTFKLIYHRLFSTFRVGTGSFLLLTGSVKHFYLQPAFTKRPFKFNVLKTESNVQKVCLLVLLDILTPDYQTVVSCGRVHIKPPAGFSVNLLRVKSKSCSFPEELLNALMSLSTELWCCFKMADRHGEPAAAQYDVTLCLFKTPVPCRIFTPFKSESSYDKNLNCI